MVGGRLIVSQGEMQTIDLPELVGQHNDLAMRLVNGD
jgi:hypothetical protein